MNNYQFEIKNKNNQSVICDIIATYHDDDTNKDFIVYTDKTLTNDNKIKLYYSLYKVENNNIKLIDIKSSEDKKIGLQLIQELIKEIKEEKI